MDESDPRAVLERLARERGDDLAALSRLIGRNSAYIQQFIRRGSPRRLAEDDRKTLAQYFGVDESLLGASYSSSDSEAVSSRTDRLIPIQRYAVSASAGQGALAEDDRALESVAFPPRWLKGLAGDASQLSIIEVTGDSMEPTLADGDTIIVNAADGTERFRDGIYVLRRDGELVVKRIACNPTSGRFTIISDNEGYRDWPDCSLEDVEILGRVVWTMRRMP